jgi:hypothetical protein
VQRTEDSENEELVSDRGSEMNGKSDREGANGSEESEADRASLKNQTTISTFELDEKGNNFAIEMVAGGRTFIYI